MSAKTTAINRMKEFQELYLTWRAGPGSSRHIVGVLKENADNRYVFKYLQENMGSAQEDGFAPYTEFPDVNNTYNGNVLDIFGQRLLRSDRPDIKTFYDFWEIEPQHKDDQFYLLGHTQGLLPTDNFEFLADYFPVEGLHFLTELAGLSQRKLPGDLLKKGDELRFEVDHENQFDKEAVKVFKDDMEIGYIKKIHSRLFHKPGAERLKLSVKAIDKNRFIKVVL